MTRMMGFLIAAGIWGCAGALSSAEAQSQPPIFSTLPSGRTSANASGTITATGTFQKVFSAAVPQVSGGPSFRSGCEVQNNGTHTVWVSEGKTAGTASESTSRQVAAGGSWYCERAGVALQGEIDITGTSGDSFYAAQY